MAESVDIRELNILIEQQSSFVTNLVTGMNRVIVGQKHLIDSLLISLLSDGHILLEGVPGLAKTLAIKTLAQLVDADFSRIQFTPDLMPADVTGTNMLMKEKDGNSKFKFQEGPVFSNIVLADEINRATPKTQSALLEAMQEHTVTVMGESKKLPEPFFVLATQNPLEQDGTYPLPEAQMDRFMFKIIVENPNIVELKAIVNLTQRSMAEVSENVCNKEQLLEMRKIANQILVADEVLEYGLRLCLSTHPDNNYSLPSSKKYIQVGASPRASQALISAAKVLALLNGRLNVSYEDINNLIVPILRHRIKLNFEAVADGISADQVITMLVEESKKK